MKNNIGTIIRNNLERPMIKKKCSQYNEMSSDEIKKAQDNLSRLIGYCILFKDNSNDAEQYMMKMDSESQSTFLVNKIANELGLNNENIKSEKYKIVDYIFCNFKENGYVFHAGNSKSILKNMKYGLNDHINDDARQNEILNIESIYRKYNPYNEYSPLGHAAQDIIEKKTGWFFDGFPVHVTTYANSPQWFEYLCGKSYVYFDAIPKEQRNGYANRDYQMSLNAVIWLISSNKMNKEDGQTILNFFNKCWKEYKDTTPCLLFIPVKEVGINDGLNINQYYSKEGMQQLLNDVIQGKVNPKKNYNSKTYIAPENLSYVDLSPILNRNKVLESHSNSRREH